MLFTMVVYGLTRTGITDAGADLSTVVNMLCSETSLAVLLPALHRQSDILVTRRCQGAWPRRTPRSLHGSCCVDFPMGIILLLSTHIKLIEVSAKLHDLKLSFHAIEVVFVNGHH